MYVDDRLQCTPESVENTSHNQSIVKWTEIHGFFFVGIYTQSDKTGFLSIQNQLRFYSMRSSSSSSSSTSVIVIMLCD